MTENAIRQGLSLVKLRLEDDDKIVAGLMAKLSLQAEESQNTGFAFIMARNFAFDAIRTAKREARARAQQMLDAKHEAELAEECRAFDAARIEFDRIVEELLEGNIRASQRRQLRVVRMWVFEQYTTEMLAATFPDSRLNQRQQWKTRGIRLISKHASENLLRWLKDTRRRAG